MCLRAAERYPYALEFVSDQYKTQEICERAVQKDPYTLEFVPDQ